ncbi:hypothetical protein B0A78_03890, partial [Flavobacterium columnare NBRC 100251 = ATCC 23463]
DIAKAKTPNDPQVQEQLKQNAPNNSKIKQYLNSAGLKVTGEIVVTGEIGFEHNVIVNTLTKEFTIIDQLKNGFVNRNEVLLKPQIRFDANVAIKYKKEFDFGLFQEKLEGKLDVDFKGAVGIKINYGYRENEGLFFKKTLYFSGIRGKYLGNFNSVGLLNFDIETNEGKPTPFTLLEPFELDLIRIQLFNHK